MPLLTDIYVNHFFPDHYRLAFQYKLFICYLPDMYMPGNFA